MFSERKQRPNYGPRHTQNHRSCVPVLCCEDKDSYHRLFQEACSCQLEHKKMCQIIIKLKHFLSFFFAVGRKKFPKRLWCEQPFLPSVTEYEKSGNTATPFWTSPIARSVTQISLGHLSLALRVSSETWFGICVTADLAIGAPYV